MDVFGLEAPFPHAEKKTCIFYYLEKKMEKNNQISNFCFIASLVSVACSIGVWCLSGDDPAHSERFGIFVGLWAPTLMSLAVYYQER